jgi:hypothetical protein
VQCGDILFSLYFCNELTEYENQKQFDFHIQINVPDTVPNHPNNGKRMTEAAAKFIIPLLNTQSYIKNVSFSENIPNHAINLDNFRKLPINFMSGNICRWYYNLCPVHLPADFTKPVLTCKANNKYKDKILISYTERYVNVTIDYKKLKEFQDKLVFIGLPKEYELFSNRFFNLEYCKTKDALEVAEYMTGAKGFLGNQSGLFSIAECLKIPRICLTPEIIQFGDRFIGRAS